ncbi:hypothetical protein HID58_066632, partial [Brassica napus]
DGSTRRGQVVEVDGEKLFRYSRLNSTLHQCNWLYRFDVLNNLFSLGFMFLKEHLKLAPFNSLKSSINPSESTFPEEMIQTGIFTIDVMNLYSSLKMYMRPFMKESTLVKTSMSL